MSVSIVYKILSERGDFFFRNQNNPSKRAFAGPIPCERSENMFTIQEKLTIYHLREKGTSLSIIAKTLNVNKSAVSMFLLRNPVNDLTIKCLNCGKEFLPLKGRIKHFCCKECSKAYWNKYTRKQSWFKKVCVCEECGKKFMVSKYKKGRFCSRECFQNHESRKWRTINENK